MLFFAGSFFPRESAGLAKTPVVPEVAPTWPVVPGFLRLPGFHSRFRHADHFAAKVTLHKEELNRPPHAPHRPMIPNIFLRAVSHRPQVLDFTAQVRVDVLLILKEEIQVVFIVPMVTDI